MASPNRSVELSPRHWDGAALVERIAGGDEGALAALYDSTCGLVYGLLLRILGNSVTADQVLVAVYQEVWEQAAAYDDEHEKLMTWLMTMAHDRAITRLRADGQNEESQSGYLKIAGRASTANPEMVGFTSEQHRIVHSVFGAFPPMERQMIELAYFYGLRQNEIAARVGLSVQSVRAGLRDGVKALRDAFEYSPSPR